MINYWDFFLLSKRVSSWHICSVVVEWMRWSIASHLWLLFVSSGIGSSYASDVFWNTSVVNVTSSKTSSEHAATLNISISANRPLYKVAQGDGELSIHIDADLANGFTFTGQTPCFSVFASMQDVQTIIDKTILQGLGSSISVRGCVTTSVIIDGDNLNGLRRTWLIRLDALTTNVSVSATFQRGGCLPLQTIAHWNDLLQWSERQLPRPTDNVYLPQDAGVIVLNNDVEIQSLTMEGGTLLLHQSGCDEGWTPGSVTTTGRRCYRKFEQPHNFHRAERICRERIPNTDSLARPTSFIEDRIVAELCGREPNGCWIGLKRTSPSSSTFHWTQRANRGEPWEFYQPWSRREPSNNTINGSTTDCAIVRPLEGNLVAQRSPVWEAASCNEQYPFVCEHAAYTQRYALTVHDVATVTGGEFRGSGQVIFKASSTLGGSLIKLTEAVTVTMADDTTNVWSTTHIAMHSGARVELIGNAVLTLQVGDTLSGSSGWQELVAAKIDASMIIGESERKRGLFPLITVGKDALLRFQSTTPASVIVRAQLTVLGRIEVVGAIVTCDMGGDLSKALVTIDNSAAFVLGDGFMVMESSGRVVVHVTAEREVIGADNLNVHAGVFRLSVMNDQGVFINTSCVPFNTTASEVGHAIQQAGGMLAWKTLVVRRIGDGSPQFGYGFSYDLSYDHQFPATPIEVACAGNEGSCGCANIAVVSKLGPNGIHTCQGEPARSAAYAPQLCSQPPTVAIIENNLPHQAVLDGAGIFGVADGIHRLPSSIRTQAVLIGGTSVIMASAVDLAKVSVTNATLFIAGAGAAGYDAIALTYAEEDTPYRSIPNYLAASTFTGTIGELTMMTGGQLLMPVGSANLTVEVFHMMGGCIGGQTLITTKSAVFNTTSLKMLRYGVTIINPASHMISWQDGDILMREHSGIVVEGIFEISAHLSKMGASAFPVQNPPHDVATTPYLNTVLSSVVLYDYSSVLLPPKIGAYVNPLCGLHCRNLPQIFVNPSGTIMVNNNVHTNWDVQIEVQGKLQCQHNSSITIAGGGHIADNGEVHTFPSSSIAMNGSFAAEPGASLLGSGRVIVSSHGSLKLPQMMNSTLQVDGGKVLFALPRHSLSDFVMISGNATLQEMGTPSHITVAGKFVMLNGYWEFPQYNNLVRPLYGVAGGELPNVVIHQVTIRAMTWLGGVIRGSADIFVTDKASLGGANTVLGPETRLLNQGLGTLNSGAKLVIYPGAELLSWDDGTMQSELVNSRGMMTTSNDDDFTVHSWASN